MAYLDQSRQVAWTREWKWQQRARGRCARCAKGEVTINPRTGEPFWLCRGCRVKESHQRQERVA